MTEPRKFAEGIANAASALPEGDRSAYLEMACKGHEALRREVERLLEVALAADGLLEAVYEGHSPACMGEGSDPCDSEMREGPGTVLGRYKLLQRLGEGGMGIVYMAEQTAPVVRKVALKVIKLGMDTRAVVARFEAERQALALMDHPNIAKVLDGGSTESGRPYFVMELVRGVPITEYCDRNRLSARERVDLFIPVCQAIQHAHQKGIIHRDIKPSNVLVTVQDGKAVPMVIDFGIAKAMNQRLTEKTLITNFAQAIGTPAYMSPEQAEMSKLDVDTRSDIYSLGVLLYELLTGTTPFTAEELLMGGYAGMQVLIVEKEPPRPSTRLCTMKESERTTVAGNRQSEAVALTRLLRGDLDWIVMKCLEKDRARRYETSNALAVDLTRHLGSEPVSARPQSIYYRTQKWMLRNRTLAITVSGGMMSLTLAAAISTSAYFREEKATRDALSAALGRQEADRAALAESIRAETVSNFAIEMIERTAPKLAHGGHREAAAEILRIIDGLAGYLTNAPKAESRVRYGVGLSYAWQLDHHPDAIRQFKAVEQICARLGGDAGDLLKAATIHRLASELWQSMDINVAHELAALGQAILQDSDANHGLGIVALSDAAEFYFSSPGFEEYAYSLALDTMRLRSQRLDAIRSKLGSLHGMVSFATARRDFAGARAFADEYFRLLVSLQNDADDKRRASGLEFFGNIWIGDWAAFPEQSLSNALQIVGDQDGEIAQIIRGLRGVAVARQGDLSEGLKILRECRVKVTKPMPLWEAEVNLERLLGDGAAARSTCFEGLAAYASGVDPISAIKFGEVLLFLSRDSDLRNVVAQLAKASAEARPFGEFAQVHASLFLAGYEYYCGDPQAALQHIKDVENRVFSSSLKPSDEGRAYALYLKSSICGRIGDQELCVRFYKQAEALHATNLQMNGVPFLGDDWRNLCRAELMRREVIKSFAVR